MKQICESSGHDHNTWAFIKSMGAVIKQNKFFWLCLLDMSHYLRSVWGNLGFLSTLCFIFLVTWVCWTERSFWIEINTRSTTTFKSSKIILEPQCCKSIFKLFFNWTLHSLPHRHPASLSSGSHILWRNFWCPGWIELKVPSSVSSWLTLISNTSQKLTLSPVTGWPPTLTPTMVTAGPSSSLKIDP